MRRHGQSTRQGLAPAANGTEPKGLGFEYSTYRRYRNPILRTDGASDTGACLRMPRKVPTNKPTASNGSSHTDTFTISTKPIVATVSTMPLSSTHVLGRLARIWCAQSLCQRMPGIPARRGLVAWASPSSAHNRATPFAVQFLDRDDPPVRAATPTRGVSWRPEGDSVDQSALGG